MRRSRLVGRGAAWLVFRLAIGWTPSLGAQGVTTSTVSGIVTDTSGNAIEGATVLALHTPTGTQYRALSRSSGAYTLPNVRVGGPYRVTATFLGFQPRTVADVFLNLGETRRLDFRLIRAATQLAGQRIVARFACSIRCATSLGTGLPAYALHVFCVSSCTSRASFPA